MANNPELIDALKRARNHAVTRAACEFTQKGDAFDESGDANPWYYEVAAPGFNFRVSDINCALGLSQLKKIDRCADVRRRLVACYDEMLAPLLPMVEPLKREPRSFTCWHIYPVRVDFASLRRERGSLMRALAAEGIGTQVHYIPLHRQPYYVARYGAQSLPGAETYYARTLTLPLHVGMGERDVERVAAALKRTLGM